MSGDKESKQGRLLEAASRLARVGGWELDLATGVMTWTDEVYRVHRMVPGTRVTLADALDRYPENDRARLEHFVRACAENRAPWSLEMRTRASAGSRWVRIQGQTVFAGDVAVRLLGSCQDVTDCRENRQARQRAEESLERTLDCIHEAVLCTDADGRLERFTPAATRLFGWDPDAVLGRRLTEVFPLRDADTGRDLPDPASEAMRRGRGYVLPTPVGRRGGEGAIIVSAAPLNDADGGIVGTVLVCRDMTEVLSISSRLHEADKLQAIGRLAGGVAHEFNNQLAGIMGFADILCSKLGHEPRLHGYASHIVTASQRAAGVVRQLLAFSRQGPCHKEDIEIDKLVAEVIGLLEHSLDRRIEIHQERAGPEAFCRADRQQLQNALFNLAMNAQEAMPLGGQLVFTAALVDLDEGFCDEWPDMVPGRYLALAAEDTGMGMDEDTRRHIFEPFFSRHQDRPGAGMGLAAVYGTIRAHGGTVTVNSRPGGGSCFTLYLPAACPAETNDAHNGPGHGGANSSPARVLVVDDEAGVRESARDILGDGGYRVITCRDGVEAVAWFRDHPDGADLVLLDLVMPRQSGAQTFRALRHLDVDARIVVCSAFDPDTRVREVLAAGAVGFLQKPFTARKLLATVRELLPVSPESRGR